MTEAPTTVLVRLPGDLADDDEPIHGHFGLSYANYLVVNRTLLQSMPPEWQRPFVALLRELGAAYEHIETADRYEVTTGQEWVFGDLSDEQMKVLGVQPPEPFDGAEDDDAAYDEWHSNRTWLYRGEEYESDDRIVVPRPDPVPHYRRGRTRVQPRVTSHD
jgi:hypothetical protein